jgi:hypothetical protein
MNRAVSSVTALDRGPRSFEGSRIDTTYWPLAILEFPKRRMSDEALAGLLGHLEALMREALETREKIVTITDLTQMRELPPASQRKLTGEWKKRTAGLTGAAVAANAHVTPSALLRGLITAVFWLHPPTSPTLFVATRAEAITKGLLVLEAANEIAPLRAMELRGALRRGGVLG